MSHSVQTAYHPHRQALFGVAILAVALMFCIPPLIGFGVDYRSFVPILLLASVPAAFIPYALWRGMAPLVRILELVSLGIAATLPIVVYTYAAMRFDFPLADGVLMAADRALGFDWLAFVRWIDGMPLLSRALGYAYTSFTPQLLLIPAMLCIAGMADRGYMLVLSYIALCAICALVSIPFPALGAYEALGLPPGSMDNINTHFGYFFLASFHGVRTDPAFVLTAANVAGIITFPSVHAGVAALCAWAGWRLRIAGPLIVLLNVMMAVSAITHGAHYLVDVLAGVVIAALVVVAVKGGLAWRAGRCSSSAPIAIAGA